VWGNGQNRIDGRARLPGPDLCRQSRTRCGPPALTPFASSSLPGQSREVNTVTLECAPAPLVGAGRGGGSHCRLQEGRGAHLPWSGATPSFVLPHKSLRPGARRRGAHGGGYRLRPICPASLPLRPLQGRAPIIGNHQRPRPPTECAAEGVTLAAVSLRIAVLTREATARRREDLSCAGAPNESSP
jgi:hypothetical protein